MSERISFNGDDLARRVPLLGTFQESLVATVTPLGDIAACRWADGAPESDELTAQAREAVRGMLADYVFPSYEVLGSAVGMQGGKLDAIHQIGDNTEATNGEVAGGWNDGGRHG